MQGFLNNSIDVEILVSLALIIISIRAYSSKKIQYINCNAISDCFGKICYDTFKSIQIRSSR